MREAYEAFIKQYPFQIESLPGEEWRPMTGFDGSYYVSNYGRVKVATWRVVKIVKPGVISSGYLYVVLCREGKRIRQYVGRLVARYFLPNPERKPLIGYKDGNPLNNYVGNIRWQTERERTAASVRRGTFKPIKRRILTEEQREYIRRNPEGLSYKELAARMGVSQCTIYNVWHGK